jgi:RNA polymerase sigma-70 factor (ECF subfamily)
MPPETPNTFAASPPSDLMAAKEGDPVALGRLLASCQEYLLLVANREVSAELRAKGGASDIVQETFLEAQRDLGSFAGTTEPEFRGWVRRLLLNNVSNFARRYRNTGKRNLRRETAMPGGSDSGRPFAVPAGDPSPSQHMVANEERMQLLAALDRLPEHYREVIELRHKEGLDYQEIGNRLQRSAEAVRKLWARAVDLLQQDLGRREGPHADSPRA